MLYSQLGITQEILNGTAEEKVMQNYYTRTIEPIVSAITDEMKRKFLTKTARTQGQSIEFFRDPFKLVPVSDLAEIADKFTRNAIVTSNEFRGIIGFKPSSDPMADELINNNLYPTQQQEMQAEAGMEEEALPEDIVYDDETSQQVVTDVMPAAGENGSEETAAEDGGEAADGQ